MSSSAPAPPALPSPPPSNPAFAIDDDDFHYDANGNRVDNDDDDGDGDDDADNANDGTTILDDGLSDFGDGRDDEEEGGGGRGRPVRRQQLTSTEAMLLKSEARRYRRLTSCAALTTMFASAVVACAFYYLRWDGAPSSYDSQQQQAVGGEGGEQEGEGGGGGGDAPVPPPSSNGLDESANEGRLRRTLDYLVATDASDPRTLLHPEGSSAASVTAAAGEGGGEGALAFMSDATYAPQYRAAVWLSQYDPARLEVPYDLSSAGGTSEYAFLQRYSLAVLCFSLGGPAAWTVGVNFLREWHECGWAETYFDAGGDVTTYGAGCDGMPDYDGDDDAEGLDAERVVTQIFLPRE